MANQEHLAILNQGVEAWNQWRREYSDILPDFKEADLSDANLAGANLSGANFTRAYLKKADLSRADLRKANLNYTHFIEAKLINADLSRALLDGTNFCTANLLGADLSDANLTGANLSGANLINADLSRANLSYATLVDTDLTKATLTQCTIYGIAAWNVQLQGATQDSLVITREDEPAITVDDLEVAQFIYLLLHHEKLRNVLNAVTKKGVLILGRFGGGGLEVLQAIAAKLREEKYLPIIFDFERPQAQDYTETVQTLAGLARFVIVDLSGPSVPQELYATAPHHDIPFVTIIEVGRKEHSMFRDLLKYPWVFPPITFTDKEQLIELLPSRIIEPAEKKCQERQVLLNQLFPR
jgi:Pentapeptide repeats (8 copies)